LAETASSEIVPVPKNPAVKENRGHGDKVS